MQNINEQNKLKHERLLQQLAEVEAERNKIQQELRALKPPQTKAASISLWNNATVSAVFVLAVASLLFTFHDAQSKVKENSQLEEPSINSQETVQLVRDKHQYKNQNKT